MTPVRRFAEVIGDPIDQSKSPAIHNFWLDRLGLADSYTAFRVERGGLPAYLGLRRSDPNWLGCNVTMPLKLDAATIADEVSDRAAAAGASNLLVARDGRIAAGNTDVGAVLALLAPRVASAAGVTLLGSGGAARAVLVALKALGVDDVRIQARDLSAAFKLAVEFGLAEEPRTFDQPIESGGLVNATPVGMAGMAPITIDISAMPAQGWVFDMVTSPVTTRLLESARARGLATIDGIAMLIEQASESFAILFGAEAPRQLDPDLLAVLRA